MIDRFLTGFVLAIIAPMWDKYVLNRWSTEVVYEKSWQRGHGFGKKQIGPDDAWTAMKIAENSGKKMHTGDACEILNEVHKRSGKVASARSGQRWEYTFTEV